MKTLKIFDKNNGNDAKKLPTTGVNVLGRVNKLQKYSSRTIHMLCSVLILLVSLMFTFISIVPFATQIYSTSKEIEKTGENITLQKNMLVLLKDKLSKIKSQEKDIDSFISYFPQASPQKEFVNSINSIASATGVEVENITFSDPTSIMDGADSTTKTKNTNSVFPIGAQKITISLSNLDFNKLTDISEKIEKLTNATSIDNVSFTNQRGVIVVNQYVSKQFTDIDEFLK